MDSFMQQHYELVIGLLALLFGGLMWFVKQKLNKVDEIEKNYLQRFEDVKKESTHSFERLKAENERMHAEVLNAISSINVNIATIAGEVKAQAQICSFVQEAKKQGSQ